MQYRMNEEIMRFSSDWFYNSAMTAAPDARWRGILDYDTPIEWHDTAEVREAVEAAESASSESDGEDSSAQADSTSFREALSGHSFGRVNKDEARLTPPPCRTISRVSAS